MDQAKLLETLKQLIAKYEAGEEDPSSPQFNGFALDPETYMNMNKLGADPRKGMTDDGEYFGVKDALKSVGAKTKVFPNSPREPKVNVFEKTMNMFRSLNSDGVDSAGLKE